VVDGERLSDGSGHLLSVLGEPAPALSAGIQKISGHSAILDIVQDSDASNENLSQTSRTPAAPTPGLRERKRRATENAIEQAAVDLAHELGPAGVTVDAICQRADISRSTFFNYFPTREQAIFGRPWVITAGEQSEAILNTYATDLPLAVMHIAVAAIGGSNVNTTVDRARRELIAAHPELAHQAAAAMVAVEQQFTGIVADWLVRHPQFGRLGPENALAEAILVARVASTAAAVMIADWHDLDDDITLDPQRFSQIVQQLAFIATPPDPAPTAPPEQSEIPPSDSGDLGSRPEKTPDSSE
jgi:AcrR family transcriptional regulator